MAQQRAVVVSDDGASWFLGGDPEEGHHPYEEDSDGDECRQALPHLLDEGWSVVSVTPGSGANDENSFWLVIIKK